MKTFLLVIAFAIAISGCTTAGELRQKATARQHNNIGKARDVAVCINEEWEKIVLNGVIHVNLNP